MVSFTSPQRFVFSKGVCDPHARPPLAKHTHYSSSLAATASTSALTKGLPQDSMTSVVEQTRKSVQEEAQRRAQEHIQAFNAELQEIANSTKAAADHNAAQLKSEIDTKQKREHNQQELYVAF